MPATVQLATPLTKPHQWARQLGERWLGVSAPREGLEWTRGAACPERLLDAGGAQIGDLLYVACGYKSLGAANEEVFVFDMRKERWVGRIAIPAGLAHSHCAIASDGKRYIYFASGQVGPQCRPAVPNVFSYDTLENHWHELPPVPAPRYAATMQCWRGRLHFIGGADADRCTPRDDHWSLAVSDGRAGEAAWRAEQPIPIAGMHRSSALVGDSLYVFGGQQGDFVAIPGDAACTCTGQTQESYLSCTFKLSEASGAWVRLSDVPIAVSHTDSATVVVDGRVLLIGGQVYKHPEQFYLRMTDAIQAYDPATDRWSMFGYLPHTLKTPVVGLLGRRLFVATGQRGVLPDGDRPGKFTRHVLATTLPPPAEPRSQREDSRYAGKKMLLISHDLSRSGAPLLLLETAQALMELGATVRVATASDDTSGWNLASQFRVPLIPIEAAVAVAADSDVIIANTISGPTASWVRQCLAANPFLARRLVWWIHEIDVEIYKEGIDLLRLAALAVFDSEAARSAWQETTVLPPRVEVLHPALSKSFVEKASLPTLPFPTKAKARTQQPVELTRDSMRKRMGVSETDFLLLCIGTFEQRKGQRMLIRTIARLAAKHRMPIKLSIVGLKNRMARSELLKELTPEEKKILSPARTYVRQSAFASFYLASDAFIMNSQGVANGRGEAFGRVTTEAMAFGLPVLGTSAGGTAEIIEDGVTGYLYPTGEEGQSLLEKHVETLVQDRALAAQLGSEGRKRAFARFQQEIFASRLAEALEPIW